MDGTTHPLVALKNRPAQLVLPMCKVHRYQMHIQIQL